MRCSCLSVTVPKQQLRMNCHASKQTRIYFTASNTTTVVYLQYRIPEILGEISPYVSPTVSRCGERIRTDSETQVSVSIKGQRSLTHLKLKSSSPSRSLRKTFPLRLKSVVSTKISKGFQLSLFRLSALCDLQEFLFGFPELRWGKGGVAWRGRLDAQVGFITSHPQ